MEEVTSREKVLKKIRAALLEKVENPFPSLNTESSIYVKSNEDNDVTFAKEFSNVAGKFIYCENETELHANLSLLVKEKKWKSLFTPDPELQKMLKSCGIPYTGAEEDFENMKAGITGCEFLIARLGSIMISSKQISGRRMNVFPESHIVFAKTSQIVPDLKDAFAAIREKYQTRLPSLISIITGASRTADIEKTLVMGAHGPKELYVLLLDNESL